MRILLITHYYRDHGGGVEVIAGQIADRLADAGVPIVWAASDADAAHGSPDIQFLPMGAWNAIEQRLGVPYPLWGPLSLLRLARAIHRCEIIHLHDCLYMGNVFAALCARWAGRPILITQHIGLVPYANPWLRRLMATANHLLGRLVLGGCDRVVFYSPAVQAYFQRFVRFPSAPVQVPNGVDRQRFHPVAAEARARLRDRLGWRSDRPVMLFVGRFVEKKGLSRLRALAQAFPGWDWALVGRGPIDPSRWGLDNVICRPAQPQAELPAYYQAADLLVLPSVGEGFPLVVQEAMTCGLPALISTETAKGCPGIEKAALIADLAPEALVQGLQPLLTEPGRLVELRAEALAFARRWDWTACAQEYHRLLRGCVERFPGTMREQAEWTPPV